MSTSSPAPASSTAIDAAPAKPKRSRALKILAGIGLVLVAGVLVVLALAATKPDVFRVERSVTINAPAEQIYPLIEDFQEWPKWSPFENLDPQMQKTFSGAERGQGAVYAWDGNSQAGKGRIEIIEAAAPSKLGMTLDFERPFECHNQVLFTLEPVGDGTKVTWAMSGPNQFMGKVMQVLLNTDAMVGSQFESGLAKLKAEAES